MTRHVPLNEQVRVPDLDQPTWLTDIPGDMPSDLDPAGHMQFNSQEHGHPGLLTIHGIRDAMHGIVEELEEHAERDARRDEIPDFLRPVLDAHTSMVLVRVDLAKAFRTDTFVLPAAPAGQTGGATLLSNRTDRMRAILTNTGANPAYLSFTDDVSNFNSLGEIGWCVLPPGPVSTLAGAVSTPTNPAAGANLVYTNQSGVPQLLQAIQGTFTTDAVVANRFVTVTILDAAGHSLWSTMDGTAVVASSTLTLAGGIGTTTNSTANHTFIFGLPSGLTIPPGGTVVVSALAIDPGDQFSAFALTLSNTLQLPGAPREFRSGGKLYGYSILGTQLDIQEEYGWRYSEEGVLSP